MYLESTTITQPTQLRWQERIGHQRSWIWRGWQVRYSIWRSPQSCGDKPPLILLHGFGASIEQWRQFIPLVQPRQDIYALDLLGFGGSQKIAVNYSVPLWAEQVYDFLQDIVKRPGIIIGNSIGSLVCTVVAKNHPEWVKASCLLSLPDIAQRQANIHPMLRSLTANLERLCLHPFLIKIIFQIVRRRSVLYRWLKLAYPTSAQISDELLDIIQAPTLDDDAATAFIALSRRVSQPDFCPPMTEILPDLSCPILLLWGEQDRFVPLAISQKLRTLNPQLSLITLPHFGHCLHDEAPEQVFALFSNWLDQL